MALTFCELFLEFLRRNATVAVVILAVLLARLLLKKLPKKYAYALWSVVALRMIFSFDIPSFFSIFNVFVHAGNDGVLPESDRMMPVHVIPGNTAGAGQTVWAVPDAVTEAASEAASSTLTSLTMFQKVMIAVGILWIIGIFALLMCGVVSYIRCKRRTKFSVKRTGNIWECDDLPSPFVLGLWKPQIYVPFHMSKEEYEYIVAHEHYHIKRKDTIIKPLAFMLLAVYWINPLVWLAYVCMVRDMEMSCDEAVLSIFGNEIKQAYSMSLLSFVTGKRNVSFVPLAFGESDASKRIKNVLRYKKPRLISAVVAVLALAVISLVCLTNASETTEQEESIGLDEKTASVNLEKETASDGDNPSDAGNNLDEENSSDDSHQPMITVTPFENILGYNGRVVKKEYVYGSEYYFYDENDTLLFMTFGEEYFVRDLDDDGENELISNRLWSDGGRATCVFVKQDNEIYIGCLDDLLDEPYDDLAFYSEYSYYLPEENVVEIFYWIEADQEYKSKKYEIDLDKLTYNKASKEIEFLTFDEEVAQALEKASAVNATLVLKDGYEPADITFVDNSEVGWDYYSDDPWNTDEQRDQLAQQALQELYTLTGYQVTECVYTTDGRSKFIFGKSADAIKKSTAFYTRDYGFTLCGDATPYMGFVNARRVWYSDIQQLDSPYHDPDYQGNGAIPVWFLEHSGVYQGQKINGFDVFDIFDNVFTHVKLLFDGGYYIVVMDEEIESAAEISGPYFETASVNNNDFYNVSTDFSKNDVEDFASLVKSQIINKDWRGVADHVVYPMTIGNRTYANRDEFVNAGWDSVLGTDFYAAIKAEDCVDMFCNSLGIRLGETGQVWIAGVWDDDLGHTDLKVIKINN